MSFAALAPADDPRDPLVPPAADPPVEEPGETPPTREEPQVGDPTPSDAPMIGRHHRVPV